MGEPKTKNRILPYLALWLRAARAPVDVCRVQRLGFIGDGPEHAGREHEILGGDDDDRVCIVVVGGVGTGACRGRCSRRVGGARRDGRRRARHSLRGWRCLPLCRRGEVRVERAPRLVGRRRRRRSGSYRGDCDGSLSSSIGRSPRSNSSKAAVGSNSRPSRCMARDATVHSHQFRDETNRRRAGARGVRSPKVGRFCERGERGARKKVFFSLACPLASQFLFWSLPSLLAFSIFYLLLNFLSTAVFLLAAARTLAF